MKAADRLGNASSFAEATRPRSERRRLIAEVTGEAPIGTSVAVAIDQIAPNPLNPRDTLGDIDEIAASLLERGQIQPATVVTRSAFLAVHPAHEEAIGDAAFVVLDGNRRLAAARAAGLASLRIDVHDQLASTAEEMLESAVVANIHRQDLAPLEEAKALRYLVEVHGSQGRVAVRLGKTPAWVSQRLALLELGPGLQRLVEVKELNVQDARRIGRLPKELQEEAATVAIHAVKTRRAQRTDTARAARPPEEEPGPLSPVNAVNTQGRDQAQGATPLPHGDAGPAEGPAGDPTSSRSVRSAVAERAPDQQEEAPDWEDPRQLAVILRRRLTSENLALLRRLLSDEQA